MAEINDLSSRVQDQDIVEGAISDDVPSDESGDPGPWNSKLTTAMSSELRQAFQKASPNGCPTHARFTAQTTISGFIHSTRQKHQGNSQVFYAQKQNVSIPGFIESIFRVENDSRQFLAVRRLLPSSVNDPFRPWPLLGVKLYANSVGELDVISVEDVQFQYASCPLKWEGTDTLATISLSRVSTVDYIHGIAGPYSLFSRPSIYLQISSFFRFVCIFWTYSSTCRLLYHGFNSAFAFFPLHILHSRSFPYPSLGNLDIEPFGSTVPNHLRQSASQSEPRRQHSQALNFA